MSRSVSLSGFTFVELSDDITTPQASTLVIEGSDDFRLQFFYDAASSNPSDGEINGELDVVQGQVTAATLNGISVLNSEDYEARIERISAGGETLDAIVIGVETAQGYELHVFRLTSNIFANEVPTRAELLSVLSNVSVAPVSSGPFSGTFDPSTAPTATVVDIPDPTGTPGDDVLNGDNGANLLDGLAGNDQINGNGGADTLIGGTGDDTLDGGNGSDTLRPGSNDFGDDLVLGSAGNDVIDFTGATPQSYYTIAYVYLSQGVGVVIDGAADTGQVLKADGQDTMLNVADAMSADGLGIVGTTQSDAFTINTAADQFIQLQGGRGSDSYTLGGDGMIRVSFNSSGLEQATNGVSVDLSQGTVFNDGFGNTDSVSLTGGNGRIELRGTNFNDSMIGHDGRDSFITERGSDTVNGGAGEDRVRYDRNGIDSVTVDLAAGTATALFSGVAHTDTLISIEDVRGSRTGSDLLQGSDADNEMLGNGGNDTLAGRGGNDYLNGGDGTDTVVINANIADITVGYNDYGIAISSADGYDVIDEVEQFQFNDGTLSLSQIEALLPPGETVVGTDGNDSLDGTGGGDTIAGGSGSDTIDGGGGDDEISGSTENDTIFGGSGDDNIGGGTGDDSIEGDTGNDTIGAGRGNDTVDGGDGDDGVFGGADDDILYGGEGDDNMGGGFGNDQVYGNAGHDDMGGGTGRDTMSAGDGNDSVGGGEGDDSIDGGAGNDFLAGGGRNDTINGGAGDDTINAGAGDDVMIGGGGSDLFIFNEFVDGETDTIFGFENGQDTIRLRGVEGQGLQGRLDALDVTNTTVDGDAGVRLTYNGHTILISGVSASDIGAEDFIFIG